MAGRSPCFLSKAFKVAAGFAILSGSFFSAGAGTAPNPHSSPDVPKDEDPPFIRPVIAKGAFLHITDIHPDEFYIPGASISSSCHRLYAQANRNFHRANQVVFGTTGPSSPARFDDADPGSEYAHPVKRYASREDVAGWWGAPGTDCDSPFSLVNATFAWAGRELRDKLDFIIWTGDNARHDSDPERPRSAREINALNVYIANLFQETFPANVPVVPSIGNNDIYPHNILPKGPNPTINRFLSAWSSFIPEDQLHVFQRGGYFVRDVIPNKLAAISLNTMYFYNENTAVNGCKGKRCPGKAQLAWLKVTLRLLRIRKMKVVISGHISPAASNYYPRCLKRYTQLVLRFRDIISAQIFGHNNIDHFFFLKEDAEATGLHDHEEEDEKEDEDDEDSDQKATVAALEVTNLPARPASSDDDVELMVSMTSKSYVDELIRSFEKLPKHAGRARDTTVYSVVHVTPSVVPVYNPSLRIFNYYTNGMSQGLPAVNGSPSAANGLMTGSATLQSDLIFHPSPWSATPSRFGKITDYVQYYVDLPALYRRDGLANATKFPGYTIEYVARDAFLLGDSRNARREEPLSVLDWINLAKRIAWDAKMRKIFMKYLYVRNTKAAV